MRNKQEILDKVRQKAKDNNWDFHSVEELLHSLIEVQIDIRDQLADLTNALRDAPFTRPGIR